MATTGLYFQWARGRAMVRNRSMRKARAIKATLVRDGKQDDPHDLRRFRISSLVGRARRANKEWRLYRALHIEFERE